MLYLEPILVCNLILDKLFKIGIAIPLQWLIIQNGIFCSLRKTREVDGTSSYFLTEKVKASCKNKGANPLCARAAPHPFL